MSDNSVITDSPDVLVKDTGTVKGRGVFAARDFAEGEMVEAAPIIVLHRPYKELAPKIQDVVYNWGDLTQQDKCSALVLGYGSLYNHSNPANMRYEADEANGLLKYTAVRDIKKNEELTVNYNSGLGSHVSETDDWFARHNVTPLDES